MENQLPLKLRITTLCSAFLLLAGAITEAGVIVIEGHYQNKNVFVQNSIATSGVGFCAYEVSINGQLSTDEINASAFEIDLTQYNIPFGGNVTIMIKHKNDGCFPKVLNPEVFKPNPTFQTTLISVGDNGLLKWTTVNETAKLPFTIQQFKWHKWVKIGEVQGKGTPTTSIYSFQTESIAGLNKFRVKQKGYIDKTIYSPTVSYTALDQEITFVYHRKDQNIDFSEETGFEVFDKYGNLVKKGYGVEFDVRNLSKDVYYMNFGNRMAEFRRK